MKNLAKQPFIVRFCNLFECNQRWLLNGGEDRPFFDSAYDYQELYDKYFKIPTVRARKMPEYLGLSMASPAQPYNPPGDFVFVQQMIGSISAGGGTVPEDTADVCVAFRKDWMKRKGSPDKMSLIKVSGDSMEPTLLSGDLVLVNHDRNSIAAQGGIYAISIDDEIMIKRVQPSFPGKLLIISDNKQYAPYKISTFDVRVNGKVIWYARDLER
jgi:phage repressor protein C with HTH and peptisase S24 domain